MAQAWQSYDSGAQSHDRLAVPSLFAQPAKDLVEALDLGAASAVLDVGSGSGIAALTASQSSGPATVVVGIDPSFEMLRVARGNGLRCVVSGALPHLPFCANSFDRVLASFVLSHLTSYEAALVEMVRVLRPGGKLGVTAWGGVRNEFRERWQSIADSFAGREALGAAVDEALPWEPWFEEPGHLESALQAAGLNRVALHHKQYTVRMSIADFLAIRDGSIQARFMRQTLDPERWKQFNATLAAEFYTSFSDPIEHERDVHIAIGTKP
jgi:SAM-dependent methyltransferase